MCTVSSPLPRAPAKTPVLAGPSTRHLPVATGPAGVWQTYAVVRRISTPAATAIRRMPALVQLPGPHGVTERSCDIASTMVAGPKPSTVPVPVLISWKMPRSAMRFVIEAVLSWNCASNRLESLAAPDAGAQRDSARNGDQDRCEEQ